MKDVAILIMAALLYVREVLLAMSQADHGFLYRALPTLLTY